MNNNPKVLVMGATREETNYLEKCHIDCKYESTILSTGIVASTCSSQKFISVG